MTRTKYKNQWRKGHRKYRNKARKRNYHKRRPVLVKHKRRPSGVRHRPWEEKEIYLLMCGHLYHTDKVLAQAFGRSVQAIQQKRYKLRKESYGDNKQD